MPILNTEAELPLHTSDIEALAASFNLDQLINLVKSDDAGSNRVKTRPAAPSPDALPDLFLDASLSEIDVAELYVPDDDLDLTKDIGRIFAGDKNDRTTDYKKEIRFKTPEEKKEHRASIEKYLKKRTKRRWRRGMTHYPLNQDFAQRRERVRGRFTKMKTKQGRLPTTTSISCTLFHDKKTISRKRKASNETLQKTTHGKKLKKSKGLRV